MAEVDQKLIEIINDAGVEVEVSVEHSGASTDGATIRIDPVWFDTLSEKEQKFVVVHEFMHTLYQRKPRPTAAMLQHIVRRIKQWQK